MASSDEKQDPESDVAPLPSNPSFRFDQNDSQQSLLSRNGSGYESQYGSLFGSRFSITDGSGIFISSLAITIITSAIAVVGIILVAVVITLAVMLSSCGNPTVSLGSEVFPSMCSSYHLNLELNNLQRWEIPSACESHISDYIHRGQYSKDVEVAVSSARSYLKNLKVDHDPHYAIIFDIDETALLHSLYHGNPATESISIDNYMWAISENKSNTLPNVHVLNLYREVRAANWSVFFISERPESMFDLTKRNLMEAGYEGWTSLILRSNEDAGLSVQSYKDGKRNEIQKQGYKILAVLGDQWNDIIGCDSSIRTFKLPNPIYQIL